jgi:hypothetical protein
MQETRRISELFSIKTVTLCKDKDLKLNNHIRSNFNQSKELLKDINDTFPEGGFEYILYVFLDHFHTPVYYYLLIIIIIIIIILQLGLLGI